MPEKGPSITFYGGINEIGGNKFLLEDRGTRIFLDFGMQMGLHGRYYDMMMPPRKHSSLADLFEFKLLPRINGIYRQDYTKHFSRGPDPKGWFEKDSGTDNDVDGVLLTHAHVDHCQYVHYLRPDIPIYCTEATKIIMQALQDTGGGSGEDELVRYKESFKTYTNSKGDESWATSEKHREERERAIHITKPYKKYKIDSVEFEALPVDHSLPGACAFIIHTSAGSIGYTGDLRFHGRRGGETEKFVRRCGKAELDYMLCEGTRVDVRSSPTEQDVEDDASEIIRGTENLAVVSYPVRDLDRFLSMYNAAVASGREMVIDFKQAYLLKLFEKSRGGRGAYPGLGDPHLRLFMPRMGKGLAGAGEAPWGDKLLMEDYGNRWEKDIISDNDIGRVTYRDLGRGQKRYVLYCSDFRLQQLVDIRPKKGSSYIHSSTEPFSDEMVLDHDRIKRWLHHFGLIEGEKSWNALHVSGHGTGDQIKRVVKESGAKRVVPIHTERADYFRYWHDGVIAGSSNGGRIEM